MQDSQHAQQRGQHRKSHHAPPAASERLSPPAKMQTVLPGGLSGTSLQKQAYFEFAPFIIRRRLFADLVLLRHKRIISGRKFAGISKNDLLLNNAAALIQEDAFQIHFESLWIVR